MEPLYNDQDGFKKRPPSPQQPKANPTNIIDSKLLSLLVESLGGSNAAKKLRPTSSKKQLEKKFDKQIEENLSKQQDISLISSSAQQQQKSKQNVDLVSAENKPTIFDGKSILKDNETLDKENDEGNIEYKWKLVNVSPDRFKHLVSQMKYRLTEGQGEAVYEVGVNNDGIPLGLNEEEYKETIENLTLMAKELKADISIICERKIEDSTSLCFTNIDKEKQSSLESTGNSVKSKVPTKKNSNTTNKITKQQITKDDKPTSSLSLSSSSSSSSSSTTTTAINTALSSSTIEDSNNKLPNHNNGTTSVMNSIGNDNDNDNNNNDTTISKKNKTQTKMVAELLIRSFEDGKYLDLRLAVCGNVDSGKSTLIGVLTRGKLDNGRGLARLNVFQHKHEISSGRTSSISHQIMGFDSKGNIVNYSQHDAIDQQIGWREIVDKSSKVVTFIDLAGHERYLKTTVFGMTGHVPDYSLIVVGSNMGVTRMTKEHIGLSLALKLPMIFIVTKIDICPENILKETLDSISKILKLPGVRKLPYIVKNEDDVIAAARNVPSDRICPIFLVSHVTGENLNLLKTFFNIMPLRRDWESLVGKSAEFFIDQTFFVGGVGTVVSGFVNRGTIKLGDTLNLGPDGNGQWRKAQVKGIHVKRNPVKSCFAGQHASFALKKEKRSAIRKGMVMVEEEHPKATWEFTAEILVLYHSTTISAKYQPVIHTMCVRQSAKIVNIFDKDSLRTGDKAKVKFRFLFRPEYVKVGARLIFREGNTKGLGVITGLVFPENETVDHHNLDIIPQPSNSIINHNNNNNNQLTVTTSTSSSSNLQTKQEKTPTSANSTVSSSSSSSSSSQAAHHDNNRLF